MMKRLIANEVCYRWVMLVLTLASLGIGILQIV